MNESTSTKFPDAQTNEHPAMTWQRVPFSSWWNWWSGDVCDAVCTAPGTLQSIACASPSPATSAPDNQRGEHVLSNDGAGTIEQTRNRSKESSNDDDDDEAVTIIPDVSVEMLRTDMSVPFRKAASSEVSATESLLDADDLNRSSGTNHYSTTERERTTTSSALFTNLPVVPQLWSTSDGNIKRTPDTVAISPASHSMHDEPVRRTPSPLPLLDKSKSTIPHAWISPQLVSPQKTVASLLLKQKQASLTEHEDSEHGGASFEDDVQSLDEVPFTMAKQSWMPLSTQQRDRVVRSLSYDDKNQVIEVANDLANSKPKSGTAARRPIDMSPAMPARRCVKSLGDHFYAKQQHYSPKSSKSLLEGSHTSLTYDMTDTEYADDDIYGDDVIAVMRHSDSLDAIQEGASSSHDDGLPHTLQNLNFHRILGEGQFGQVWLVSEDDVAEEDHHDLYGEHDVRRMVQPYALKIFSKYDLVTTDQVDMVLHERNVMRELPLHPFLVHLHASFVDENLIYLLEDYCPGGELFSLLHQPEFEHGMPECYAQYYIACLADALSALHQRRFVYRDLKPENIMLDARGRPRLIDFGYTKRLRNLMTKTYTLCGTPRFLAPEAVKQEGTNHSADHWALGILVYELLTGENPFYYDGLDEISLFVSIAEDDYKEQASLSAEASDMLRRLLEKDPVMRLGADDIHAIQEHAWLSLYDPVVLRKGKLSAPWIPPLTDDLDTQNFDDYSRSVDSIIDRKHPYLTFAEKARFEEF